MDVRTFLGQLLQSDISGFSDKAALKDLDNWDSLKAVRLVLRLEEVTGRSLSESDIESLRTIDDVQQFISGKPG